MQRLPGPLPITEHDQVCVHCTLLHSSGFTYTGDLAQVASDALIDLPEPVRVPGLGELRLRLLTGLNLLPSSSLTDFAAAAFHINQSYIIFRYQGSSCREHRTCVRRVNTITLKTQLILTKKSVHSILEVFCIPI